MKTLVTTMLLVVTLVAAQADDRRGRKQEPNWILERQLDYKVQGMPTSRIIVGTREIDVYPNGLMFEKGNVVGVTNELRH